MRWLPGIALLLACGRIGEPIVRPLGEAGNKFAECPELELDCETAFRSHAPYAVPVPVVPSALCDGEVPAVPCRDAQQGGGCVLALRVVADAPFSLPAQACATIDMTPAPGSARADIQSLKARSSTLSLRAEQPTTFRFASVDLQDVAIELSGPVSLALTGSLANVSISSSEAALVTLMDSLASSVAVSLPRGELRMERTTLSGARLLVQQTTLETVSFNDVAIRAERMVGLDLDGQGMRLDVSDLSFSDVDIDSLDIDRCDTALLNYARISDVNLSDCSDRMRTRDASISNGRAQGLIESTRTLWSRMHFGAGGGATTLEMWLGTLASSVLCPDVQRLTVSSGTGITCNDCTLLEFPEQQLCLFDPSGVPVDPRIASLLSAWNLACPLLDEGLPECDPSPLFTP
jgi:uncharacterized protein YjbI with pentapeptide repeats